MAVSRIVILGMERTPWRGPNSQKSPPQGAPRSDVLEKTFLDRALPCFAGHDHS